MKLQNDGYYEEEHGSGSNMIYVYMVLIMSVVILGVTAIVFWVNSSKSRNDGSGYAAAVAQRDAQTAQSANMDSGSAATVISDNKLTSDDLDIWTLPDTGRTTGGSKSNKNNGTVKNQTTGETVIEGSSEEESGDKTVTADELAKGKTSVYDMPDKENIKDEEDTQENDKKVEKDKEEESRIQVKRSDGTKEWVDLSQDIERNDYDYANLKYQKPVMNYFEEGKIVSKCGADISANQGDVDFSKLKKAGCDFVMIKIGARGYSSGNIVFDEKYKDNLKAAKKAGLDIGVYFCSQAVNKSEAREEADELLDAIADYDVKYPVAFVMETVEGDMARIEALNMEDRTSVAKAFLDRVYDEGYTPMLYGDKEWLLTMLDMERLSDYDVWYAQDSKEPDYPYEFGMWQYDSNTSVNGVSGKVAMSMSFTDYSK